MSSISLYKSVVNMFLDPSLFRTPARSIIFKFLKPYSTVVAVPFTAGVIKAIWFCNAVPVVVTSPDVPKDWPSKILSPSLSINWSDVNDAVKGHCPVVPDSNP